MFCGVLIHAMRKFGRAKLPYGTPTQVPPQRGSGLSLHRCLPFSGNVGRTAVLRRTFSIPALARYLSPSQLNLIPRGGPLADKNALHRSHSTDDLFARSNIRSSILIPSSDKEQLSSLSSADPDKVRRWVNGSLLCVYGTHACTVRDAAIAIAATSCP
jgi:hypothetical protein